MEFSALASGSSGNCFYIGDEKKKYGILIDAGISAKQIKNRLSSLGKNPESIKGIFITHEHSDHIRGSDVFAREFKIPVFATKKTSEKCALCSDEKLIHLIRNRESLKINNLHLTAFSKSHAAADPVSYSISLNGKKASVITDLGYCCKNVIENVSDSNFLCLESNHDPEMLENGPYPFFLKKWIKGDDGHLSNTQAGLCVMEHASSKLKHIVLSHLSQTNNTPELALRNFNSLIKERKDLARITGVSLSSRECPTQLFRI